MVAVPRVPYKTKRKGLICCSPGIKGQSFNTDGRHILKRRMEACPLVGREVTVNSVSKGELMSACEPKVDIRRLGLLLVAMLYIATMFVVFVVVPSHAATIGSKVTAGSTMTLVNQSRIPD